MIISPISFDALSLSKTCLPDCPCGPIPISKNATWQSDIFVSLGRRALQKANFEYNGEFFVFIVYDRPLDADEILQLHNAFKDRYGL